MSSRSFSFFSLKLEVDLKFYFQDPFRTSFTTILVCIRAVAGETEDQIEEWNWCKIFGLSELL